MKSTSSKSNLFNVIPKNTVKYIVGNVKNLYMIFVVDKSKILLNEKTEYDCCRDTVRIIVPQRTVTPFV